MGLYIGLLRYHVGSHILTSGDDNLKRAVEKIQ